MRVTVIQYVRTELLKLTARRGPSRADVRKGLRSRSVHPGLRIVDVMEGNLETVRPDTPISEALRLMIRKRISSVPVVDEEGRIAGALNESGLMKVFYDPDARCAADVMARHPIVLPIDAPLVDVIDRLMSSGFRRVLIEENGRLAGVITRSHVMPALLAALEAPASSNEGHTTH